MTTRRPDGVTEIALVQVHPGLCEGWGQCHRWASDIYTLDDEGHIDVQRLSVPPADAERAWAAAEACPTGAITIIELVTEQNLEPPLPID